MCRRTLYPCLGLRPEGHLFRLLPGDPALLYLLLEISINVSQRISFFPRKGFSYSVCLLFTHFCPDLTFLCPSCQNLEQDSPTAPKKVALSLLNGQKGGQGCCGFCFHHWNICPRQKENSKQQKRRNHYRITTSDSYATEFPQLLRRGSTQQEQANNWRKHTVTCYQHGYRILHK